ncbi:MAG: SurA N-terminal domain-containing protein [Deltaproteobacteria bacterium]|jgi:peptidyl-prolyl cis-trans isomerase SurA|nr:SurA N-terminal domain-containing protein [Deltaproteobacteria bacterium]
MRERRTNRSSLIAALAGAAAFLTAALWTAAPASAAPVVDRIVAQVNREVITLSELEAQMKLIPQAQKDSIVAQGGDVQREVLGLLIEQELVNQDAKRQGIMVSEAEIDEAVKSIMEDNKLTPEQFKASLTKGGTNLPAFRSGLKLELLKNKILGLRLMSKIVVTEAEITAFLRGEGPRPAPGPLSGFGSADDDRVLMIFLASSPSQANKVMARARQIKAEIEAGLTFSEAATRYSEGPGKDKGGDAGNNLTVSELQPQLQAVARRLTPGEVSEPLNGGQAVLLMTTVSAAPPPPREKRPEPEKPKKRRRRGKKEPSEFSDSERASARRQLEQIKLRQKFDSWMAELRSKAVVRISL